jgi:TPR repeat protein
MADFNSPDLLAGIQELDNANYQAAFALLVPLASVGNPKAQCNLATLYHLGLGVQRDVKKAVELYREVSEQNIREEHLSASAYNNLSTIYSTGAPGIEPDAAQANRFLERARELGFEM